MTVQITHLNPHWRRLMQSIEEAQAEYSDRWPIDEYAIFTHSVEEEFSIIETAMNDGWEVFNMARDKVKTKPIPGFYLVHYTFLRKEGVPYRLEVMRIISGHSPFHHSMDLAWQHTFSGKVVPWIVHSSFKVQGLLGLVMTDTDLALAQRCASTYGAFSYYVNENLRVAVKPRVNLRDVEAKKTERLS